MVVPTSRCKGHAHRLRVGSFVTAGPPVLRRLSAAAPCFRWRRRPMVVDMVATALTLAGRWALAVPVALAAASLSRRSSRAVRWSRPGGLVSARAPPVAASTSICSLRSLTSWMRRARASHHHAAHCRYHDVAGVGPAADTDRHAAAAHCAPRAVVLLVSVLLSLVFAGGLVIVQIIVRIKNNAKPRRLKYAATGKWVECKQLSDPQGVHLFLSHAGPAAQDRMCAS